MNFNASNLSSGVYFYNLTSGSYSINKKMILMK
ncbi:MAG TPA: T9SS type A sorting domain-containing protein [Ignavibacteriaceae bacterium]|nr:T9SS type A sorting domain-containing protein [Ignavibacteriaceae bacterium]